MRAAGTSGRHLGADAAATALALAAAVAGGVAAGVLVARALGPAGRGAFELARTIASVAATAAGLGVGGAAVFLRPRGELEEGQILGAVAGALATGALAAAALDLLLTATGWLPLGPLHLAMVCAAIPLIAFYYQAQAALQGFGGGAWYRRTLAARDALFLVLLVAAFWRERTLTLLLAAWDAHWLASAVAVAALLVRRCGRPRLPRVRLRRLVAIGSSQLLLTLLVRAHLRLDVVLLAVLRGPHTLGEYAVAVGAAQPLAYVGVAVSTALYPRSAASSARAPGGGAVATARAVRATLALALAGAAVLAVAGPSLVTAVFGAGFAAAGTPLRVLLPGVVAMTAFLALQSDLAGRGRARVVAASSLAAVAANLGLNALLIPRLGATGAAAASSVTYVLAAALLVRLFARETGVPARACLLVRADDVRAVAALRPAAPRVVRLARTSVGLRRFLAEPLAADEALAGVRARVEAREERFLEAARLLYAHGSPYRRLLEQAGCEHGDLAASVRARGIEQTLETLHDAGVRVDRDELKGLRPIVRGGLELRVEPEAFDSPMLGRGSIGGTTSGTRARPLRVGYSLAGLAEEAATERALNEAHGIAELPATLWLPAPPGAAGIHNVLLRAKGGRPPVRWLSQVEPSAAGRLDRLAVRALVAQARLHGVRLPRPEALASAEADAVVDLLVRRPHVLRTFVGPAVRVASLALERGIDLAPAVAVVGGEPLTPARRALLEAAGFRVVARFSSGETGLIAGGCADGLDADDCHVYLDRIAAIAPAGRLLVTSVSPHAGKLLLNVDLGDDAELVHRPCGCLLGALGMDLHVSGIRSRAAHTHEGMTVPAAELAEAVAAVAVAEGGTPDDVQVRHGADGDPLELVLSPRLAVDEARFVDRVLAALAARGRQSALAAEVWRGAGTLRVVRAWPEHSAGGKLAPLVPRRV